MLFSYKGKIYIKPFDNKMVEVNVAKKGNEYNVVPTEKWVYLDNKAKEELFNVTVEQAFKMQSKSGSSKEFDLD